MRRNRKIPKRMSVVATNTMRFGAILFFFFIMVILNLLSSTSCTQLLKTKGELEREIVKLDDELMRESTRWEKMKTPDNVEQALLRHGLAMKLPRPDQTVRLMSDGRPRPGQLSLARAKMRGGLATSVASVAGTKKTATKSAYRRAKRSVR